MQLQLTFFYLYILFSFRYQEYLVKEIALSEINDYDNEPFGNTIEFYTETFKKESFKISIKDREYNNVRFINCEFTDIFIKDCIFENCKFENCSFKKVRFENVRFESCNFFVCNFDYVLLHCEIKKSALFEVKISNDYTFDRLKYQEPDFNDDWSTLEPEVIKQNNIRSLSIIDTEMLCVEFNNLGLHNALFKSVSFQMVMFKNKTNISNSRFLSPKEYFDISFDNSEISVLSAIMNEMTVFPDYNQIKKVKDLSSLSGMVNYYKSFIEYDILDMMMCQKKYKTPEWFNNLCFIRKVRSVKLILLNFLEERVEDYRSSTSTYFDIANQFKLNGIQSKYGENYYIAKKLNHKTLHGYKKLNSYLANISCGYGEKWWNGIKTSLFIIVFSAFIYLLNGLKISDTYTINYHLVSSLSKFFENDWSVFISDIWDCLYFSMMTFTTVGYGNMEAIGFVSEFISFIQMFIGVILIAITTGSLLRKLFR